jgi:hypothetical protein
LKSIQYTDILSVMKTCEIFFFQLIGFFIKL